MPVAGLPDLTTLDAAGLREMVLKQHQQISSHGAEIERLRLIIARLQRLHFGRKSEKIQRQLDQLELQLEDLEARTAEEQQPAEQTPGSEMISGRDDIKQFWSKLVDSANAKSAVLESVDVILAGEGAIEIGRATLTVAPAGQPEAQMEVKYVVHWQQEDGRWKWNIDIWNTNA